MCDFIQNEIRQKINLYSQDEHQTLVDKRMIANLEKVIHFLKIETKTKNEIIKIFIKNDSHRNENNNVPQLKIGKFGSLMNMSTKDQNLILYLHVIHTLHMIHAYQVTQIPMK